MDEVLILIAEDDVDDRFLLQSAFDENGYNDKLEFVENGIELLDYLNKLIVDGRMVKTPCFIMIDLNMPKKDGREVLREIKLNPQLSKIPLIVFSTTSSEQEKSRCYELGASSYITKPSSFDGLKKIVAALRSYWVNGLTNLDKGL